MRFKFQRNQIMFLCSRRKHYKRGPTGVYHRIDSRNLHSESYNSGALHTVMLHCYNVHAPIAGIPIKNDASLLLKALKKPSQFS